jgi:putative endonuclease
MAQLEDRRTPSRRTGDLGEDIACIFLEKHGYEIIERNYLQKWGEIDIVAKRGSVLHFVEVKSVSRTPSPYQGKALVGGGGDKFRPEENMHRRKLKRIARTMQTYLLHKKHIGEWQLDLITVKMDMNTRKARVELIENIVI